MGEMLVRLDPSNHLSALRLSAMAGWNHTSQDWLRLIELEPEGCFGIALDGEIVATTTTTCYGEALAWIGMVVTDPNHRGRGFARRLMEHALAFLRARGVAWVKLDATDMGQPLYRRLGFEDEGPIQRWARPSSGWSAPPTSVRSFVLDPDLDASAFGADRSRLLLALAAGGEAACLTGAFAMGRSGDRSSFFGPCVTREPEQARSLLEWYLARHPGEEISWNILLGNQEALRLARTSGFEPRRELMRMALRVSPDATPLKSQVESIYATAGFQFG
jgi:GNAT superfamily N-acetyltransferase